MAAEAIAAGITAGGALLSNLFGDKGSLNKKQRERLVKLQEILGIGGLRVQEDLAKQGRIGLDQSAATLGRQPRRDLETAGLRDRSLQFFEALMKQGAAPGRFQPRDIFNPNAGPVSTSTQGPEVFQQAFSDFEPGRAVNTRNILAELEKLGFRGTR